MKKRKSEIAIISNLNYFKLQMIMQNESSEVKSTLSDYHQKRSKAALEAVEQMLKQPCSLEDMRSQIQARLTESVKKQEEIFEE